jgi:hypothetical protein
MVEGSAGHGINTPGDVFVTDFRTEFALEILVPGDATVGECECHGAKVTEIFSARNLSGKANPQEAMNSADLR